MWEFFEPALRQRLSDLDADKPFSGRVRPVLSPSIASTSFRLSLVLSQNPHIDATLKDGTPVVVYLVNPCDEVCIRAEFEKLSAKSRYWRFHTPIKSLSKAQLRHLTQIDNINKVAIAAVDASTPMIKGAGIARYIRVDTEPQVAEFSITVADTYQGRGLGSLLLELLISRAHENEIRTLRAYVLQGNRPMVSILHRHAAEKRKDSDGAPCYELDIT